MNEEELKQEAEEKAFDYADVQDTSTSEWVDKEYIYIQIVNAYEKGALDFAESREKQIAELGEHCLQLQKDKGNLTDRVIELEAENEQIKNSDTLCKLIGEQKRKITELEAQIEKMKCCLSTWYEYENERDTPQINIDELLTETQQLIS